MNAPMWERARNLFAKARQLDSEQWQEYLDRNCQDTSLRRELQKLLESDRRAAGFMEPSTRAAGDPDASLAQFEDVDPFVDRKLGTYQILQHLGEGGVGAVYLAARVDGEFQQRVALKVLKRGMDTDDIVRRFRTERQILAALHHPNIAELLDGGSTADGLPYFVMEYIEGKPLDEFCDRHDLSIGQRLELFCTVCSAVHFAHQNLVVHRDLKPSNILVVEGGTPKLLDFGIAKLLNPELSPQDGAATSLASRMMTPDFASPEQVQGDTITTASDIYSLGVVLYILLTGQRPYRIRGGSRLEMERVICTQEPTPLSAARAAADSLAETNSSSHSKRSRLAGDLENIVAMAMRKEPQCRYASVDHLAADIRRYLEGQPVAASGASLLYLARKFLRRHRVAVAVTVTLFLASLGLSFALATQKNALRGALAREQFATEFLTGLFEVSNPLPTDGTPISAREILDRGRDRLTSEFGNQPEYQARLTGMVGNVYSKLGEYGEAERLLRRALAQHHETDPEVASNLSSLAEILLQRAEYDEAEELAREALAMHRELQGNHHPNVIDTLNILAGILKYNGRSPEAEPLYREAVAAARQSEEHPVLANSCNNLAILLQAKGESDEAESLLREALTIRRQFFRPDHPLIANSLNNLASALQARESFTEAETFYQESLTVLRQSLGEQHPDYAKSLVSFASLLIQTQQYSRAESPLRDSAAIFRATLPSGHMSIGYSESLLGACLVGLERYAEAEPMLRNSYEILKAHTGESSPYCQKTRQRLITVYRALGQPERAAALRPQQSTVNTSK